MKCLIQILVIFSTLFASAGPNRQNGPHLETDLLEKFESEVQAKNLSAKDIQKRNQRTILKLMTLPLPMTENDRAVISLEEANQIVETMRVHPVVGNPALKFYDPEGCIGFCFGRATWAHLEAIRRKINPASSMKAFVVGSMTEGKRTWGWHVSEFVRTDDGEWRALDEATGAITLQEWLAYWTAMDSSGRVRLYMTDPRKFTAGMAAYEDLHLRQFYNGYFVDMFQDEGIAAAYMKVQFPSSGRPQPALPAVGLLCKEIFSN